MMLRFSPIYLQTARSFVGCTLRRYRDRVPAARWIELRERHPPVADAKIVALATQWAEFSQLARSLDWTLQWSVIRRKA